MQDSIADFAGGQYYDRFEAEDEALLSEESRAGLAAEVQGTLERIDLYYGPILRRDVGINGRVLDSGYGNGLSVQQLLRHGFNAWGHDLSQLRRWQWTSLAHRERLCVADGRSLPFAGGFFDAVLSSGVIEHIGVEEARTGSTYSVRARPQRDDERRAYLRELLRVVKPGGLVLVDCPNGAFPIDFWHGTAPGRPRPHRLSEGFLPTVGELKALVRSVDPAATVVALSPYNRLQFRQAGAQWYTRAFVAPMRVLFRLSSWRVAAFLRPMLPYIVVKIVRSR